MPERGISGGSRIYRGAARALHMSCNPYIGRRTGYNCASFDLRFAPMQEQDITDAGFEEAFGKTVDLGNRIAEGDVKADLWDVADGMLAGALQFWLYSRQPCGDANC